MTHFLIHFIEVMFYLTTAVLSAIVPVGVTVWCLVYLVKLGYKIWKGNDEP